MALCRSRIPVPGAAKPRPPPPPPPTEKPQIVLSLRKPQNWRVALTTAASSAAIAIPDISLRDDRGRILIDTAAPEKREKLVSYVNAGVAPRNRRPTSIPVPKTRKTPRGAEGVASGRKNPRTETAVPNQAEGRPEQRRSSTPRTKIPCRAAEGKATAGCSRGKATVRLRPPAPGKGDSASEGEVTREERSHLARASSEVARVPGQSRRSEDESAAGAPRGKRRLVTGRPPAMGSNVSRHSGKGLSGRRTQSSGNLCNGAKILAPRVGRILNSCGAGGVSNRDRNKFCGSLPNHLDEKELRSGECTPESIYSVNNNYGDVYIHPPGEKAVELLFHKLVPVHQQQQQQQQQDFSGGDQGYGSERSPEEELPPSLPTSEPPSRRYSTIRRNKEFSFITKENTYEARLEKGTRGIGLSVTGGVDTGEKFPGLIRIKRIFPNQPAWECNMLQVGDIILAANGVPLTGLTNYEALQVLRNTPNNVVLKVSRPPTDVFCMGQSESGEPPPPPRRDPAHVISSSQLNVSNMLPLPQLVAEPYEFEIVLRKVNGSLGFLLRKEDESILGHCVRALVREPALSDGRIRPGDKIVTVNGVDISPMSHEEAVMYVRQCGEEVRLRLYRDPAQTPVSALSPTESCKTFRPKPALRKEAMDMLCDLAVKKLSPSDSSSSSGRSRLRASSPGYSPLRRKPKKNAADGEEQEPEEKPQRPNFLDLCGEGGGRRARYEEPWPDEDADSLLTSGSEATTHATAGSATRAGASSDEGNSEEGAFPGEPSSMPAIASSASGFSYKNPAYQSAHPTVPSESEAADDRLSDQDIPDRAFGEGGGSHGLLKWKGVLFTPEDGVAAEEKEQKHSQPPPPLSSSSSSSRSKHSREGLPEDGEILTVELSRGWNSRLGFSLQSCGSGTSIRAIYADSVAAKDGRLQPGDQVIMINDESTEDMVTSDVIDLLRKIRGSIAITVRRSRKEKS